MGEENYSVRKKGEWNLEELIQLFRLVEKKIEIKLLKIGAEKKLLSNNNDLEDESNDQTSKEKKKPNSIEFYIDKNMVEIIIFFFNF